MIVYPYKMASESAKALALALGVKRLRKEGPPIKSMTLINWGSTRIDRRIGWVKNFLNIPYAVSLAANKLEAFKTLSGHVPIPEFTERKEEASRWLAEGYKMVVCRTILNGHSGQGIVLAKNEQELVDAPLYTKYIPKKQEYRVHVGLDNQVFFIQQKKKRDGADANFQIRNHANGFIYANQGVDLPEQAKGVARNAIIRLGLDFGAVDIIYNQKIDEFFVLEVNTAPGLSGTTLQKYVEMFKGI